MSKVHPAAVSAAISLYARLNTDGHPPFSRATRFPSETYWRDGSAGGLSSGAWVRGKGFMVCGEFC